MLIYGLANTLYYQWFELTNDGWLAQTHKCAVYIGLDTWTLWAAMNFLAIMAHWVSLEDGKCHEPFFSELRQAFTHHLQAYRPSISIFDSTSESCSDLQNALQPLEGL